MICFGVVAFVCAGCTMQTTEATDETQTTESQQEESTQAETDGENEFNLRDVYGSGYNYLFTYKGEDFTAIYSYDNWCIFDSYKITNGGDMKKICQALIDEHPVHGKDYVSYRTAKDMAYEWKQHNIAHAILPDDNPWKTTTGNVDFDPEDQGKSVDELYESRTGQEFNFSDHKDDIKEYVKRFLQ